ncbi:MAG: hypothetical protein AAF184_16185 [Pseudomonadota bacterium]
MSGSPADRDDLSDLQALWQTQPSAVSVDVDQLQATLRRRQRLTRWMMWGDWLVTVVVLVLIAWVALTSPELDLKTYVWMGFLGTAGVAALLAGIRVRRPVWSVAEGVDADARSLIDASIRQAEASLGIVRIVYWTVGACFVFMVGWGAGEFWGGDPLTGDEQRRRLLAYGFALLYGGAFLVGGAVVARRKRAEIARWQSLREALAAEE